MHARTHTHTSVTPERNSSAALSALKWKVVCGIKKKKKGIQDCCERIQADRAIGQKEGSGNDVAAGQRGPL